MNKTILSAWKDAYVDFKSDCDDGRPMWVHLSETERSHVLAEYRPYETYAQVFDKDLFAGIDRYYTPMGALALSLCDALDEHMYRMFEHWATLELREMFEREVKHISSITSFDLANDGEYEMVLTRAAFEVWKIAKGFER